jgi:hypothetical protein
VVAEVVLLEQVVVAVVVIFVQQYQFQVLQVIL